MQAHIAAAEQLIGGGDSESSASRQAGDAGDADLVRACSISSKCSSLEKLALLRRIECTYRAPQQEQRALLHKMVCTYHMWVMKAMLMVDAMPGSDDDAKVTCVVLSFSGLRLAGHDETPILEWEMLYDSQHTPCPFNAGLLQAQRKALVKDINAALDALDRLIKLSSSAGPEDGPQEPTQ